MKKIKIFNDRNLNENVVKINYVTFFDKAIKLGQVINTIKDNDTSGHKNIDSFRAKYLKNNVFFEKLSIKGHDLMKKLFEISDENIDESASVVYPNKTESYEDEEVENDYKEVKSDKSISSLSSVSYLSPIDLSSLSESFGSSTNSSIFVKKKLAENW